MKKLLNSTWFIVAVVIVALIFVVKATHYDEALTLEELMGIK